MLHDFILTNSATAPVEGEVLIAQTHLMSAHDNVQTNLSDPTRLQTDDTLIIGGETLTITNLTLMSADLLYENGDATATDGVVSVTVHGNGTTQTYLILGDGQDYPNISSITIREVYENQSIFLTENYDTDNQAGIGQPPQDLNYIVEGTELGETIGLGYDADPEGDQIDAFDHSDGSNDDSIEAYGGNDVVYGGEGRDTINAGTGDDTVTAGFGDDVVNAGDGNDRVLGGQGNDVLSGEAGNDNMNGGAGFDYLTGGAGNDSLRGNEGNDTLHGGEGANLLEGEEDRDVFVATAGDTVDGGTGSTAANDFDDVDTLDLTGLNVASITSTEDGDGNSRSGTVYLQDDNGNAAGTIVFSEIENIIGYEEPPAPTPQQIYDSIVLANGIGLPGAGGTLTSGTDMVAVNDDVQALLADPSLITVNDTLTSGGPSGTVYDIQEIIAYDNATVTYNGGLTTTADIVGVTLVSGGQTVSYMIPTDASNDLPNITSISVGSATSTNGVAYGRVDDQDNVTLGEASPEPVTLYDFLQLDVPYLPGVTNTLTTGTELDVLVEPVTGYLGDPSLIQEGDQIEIGGVTYTVDQMATYSDADVTYDGGTSTTTAGFVGITITSGSTALHFLVPADAKGDLPDITEIQINDARVAIEAPLPAYDGNDYVTLFEPSDPDPNTYVIYDAIVTQGAMQPGDTFTTDSGQLIDVLDGLVVTPNNAAGVEGGAITVGSEIEINGVTWSVDAVSTLGGSILDSGDQVSTVNFGGLVLSAPGQQPLHLVLPQDAEGPFPSINSVTVNTQSAPGTVQFLDVESYNQQQLVELAVDDGGPGGPTVFDTDAMFDFVQTNVPMPGQGEVLSTNEGELVGINEGLVFNGPNPDLIEAGDTVQIGNTTYTVSTINSATATVAYNHGADFTQTSVNLIELAGGPQPFTIIGTPDSAGDLEHITQFQINSIDAQNTSAAVSAMTGNDTVTLSDGIVPNGLIFDLIELTSGQPNAGDSLISYQEMLVVRDEQSVILQNTNQVQVGDTFIIDGREYVIDSVSIADATIHYDHGNSTANTEVALFQMSWTAPDGTVSVRDMLIPADGPIPFPDITQININNQPQATDVPFGLVDTDNVVELASPDPDPDNEQTAPVYDAIIINGTPQTNDHYTITNGGLIDELEPLQFTGPNGQFIEVGDTVTIDGHPWTVSAMYEGAVDYTYDNGALTSGDVKFRALKLTHDNDPLYEMDLIFQLDAQGDFENITEMHFSEVGGTNQIDVTEVDANDEYNLGEVQPTETLIHDAILITTGLPNSDYTLVTGTNMDVVADDIVLQSNNPTNVVLGDTFTIGQTTYDVTATGDSTSEFTYNFGADTQTGTVNFLTGVDENGNEVVLAIPSDDMGPMPDITEFSGTAPSLSFGGLPVDALDDDQNVTLAQTVDPEPGTVQLYDFIQLTEPTNGNTASLSHCSDMQAVVEPVIATLQDPDIIQLGDMMNIGGVDYEVVAVATQNNSEFTYNGGQTASVNTVTFTLRDDDGNEVGFIAPVDAGGPLPLISNIEVLTLSTSVSAITNTLDDDNNVTLVEPDFIVEGTEGNDVIDVNYTGDPECDLIEAMDHSDGSNNDSVEAYGGDDLVRSETGDDTVLAGTGNDTVWAGTGNDQVSGGEGDDLLYGEAGNDSLDGGAGNDTVEGGTGDDNITGSFGEDLLLGQDGNDTIAGGADSDTISGGDGNDMLVGQLGSDSIDGGTGTDSVSGGIGNDTINVADGQGENDLVRGDDDQDLIYADAGDTVDGGAGGDDYDTLDLSGTASPGGTFNITVTGPDSNGNGVDGFVEYFDADGLLEGTLIFSEIEHIIPCFTPGTLIKTRRGEVAVEHLKVGDLVLTADHGFQPLQWIGHKALTKADLNANPAYRPVRIGKGALGKGLPERDMLVSPQHRMLLNTPEASLWFASSEVLVAAKHLTILDGIDVVDVDEVTYIHIMCNAHEIVCADGAWSESFQPGDMSLAGMDHGSREELMGLFPELGIDDLKTQYSAARQTLKSYEVGVLFENP